MNHFEILEHTADTGFRVYGETLDDLFANAAMALASIVMDTSRAEALQNYPVTIAGEALDDRLVSWLNEVLYLMDGYGVAPAWVSGSTVWGEPRDDRKHPPLLVVKAVTYHQLSIRQESEGWVAEVFLDI